ncbi:MAG: MATE family efflux transporter [Candidatus Ornithospirochaeta sp.]|nr:MATE family efflux transporter [Candidatus Ornithospirochaeta sp.]
MESDLIREPVERLFLKYLMPSLGGALVTSVYSIVDTIAVGQSCGPLGAAAMSVINPLFAIECFLGMLLGVGTAIQISTSRGQGREDRANAVFTCSLILLIAVSAASWLIVNPGLERMMVLFGADDELLPYTIEYAQCLALCFPVFIATVYLPSVLRADEDPSLVMKAITIGGIVNIFGDWFFVFPLGMGMRGAGLATALGTAVQLAVLLIHFAPGRSRLRIIRPDSFIRGMRRIIQTGFGSSIFDVAIGAITVLVNKQAMRYSGSSALAVLGVIMTISFLLQHFYTGIGQAIQPIASTSFGAGRNERVRRCFILLVLFSLAFGIISTVLCFIFPNQIIRLFIDADSAVLEIGPGIIRAYSLSFLTLALNLNLVFFFQSILKNREAMAFSLERGLVLSGTLLIVLPPLIGFDGILVAVILSEIITTLSALPFSRIVMRSLDPEHAKVHQN